jgi:hypothetical protein
MASTTAQHYPPMLSTVQNALSQILGNNPLLIHFDFIVIRKVDFIRGGKPHRICKLTARDTCFGTEFLDRSIQDSAPFFSETLEQAANRGV